MKWNPITRRFFLQSSGSLTLSLPFLGSISTTAMAQAASQKNLICFLKPHGSYPEHYFPHNPYQASQNFGPVTQRGNGICEFQLGSIQGAMSPIFHAGYNPFRNDMNIYLGLSAANNNHNPAIPFATARDFPSIEQLAALSPRFNPGRLPVQVVQATPNFEDPASFAFVGNTVQSIRPVKNIAVLYQNLFANASPPPPNQGGDSNTSFDQLLREKKLVDSVYEDYQRLINNRRLSQADRQRLEEYMEFVFEKQEQVNTLIASADEQGNLPTRGGTIPNMPDSSVDQNAVRLIDAMVDLMVAGIDVGVSRSFNFQLAASVDETNFDLNVNNYVRGNYHSVISHSTARANDHLAVDRHLFDRALRAWQLLKNRQGSNGSLADDTVMLISGDIGAGDPPFFHTSHSLIAVSFSGANTGIRSGNCLAYSSQPNGQGYPNNQLLVGALEAVGATDWRSLLTQRGINSEGFGLYGGTQRAIGSAEKMRPLPFMMRA